MNYICINKIYLVFIYEISTVYALSQIVKKIENNSSEFQIAIKD